MIHFHICLDISQDYLEKCCDIAVAQINYPSLRHNTQDSIEQARG